MRKNTKRAWKYPKLRKYLPRVHQDLSATYTRDLHKWLLISPIIGVVTGLAITAIAVIILQELWPALLNYYLRHHWAIVPGVVLGFVATGLIMQFLTPDPDEHSTEEIVRSYHAHQGNVDMRPFFPKLLAAITTVGFGGSAALEGPSIYGGGAIGSWLWAKLRRFHLQPRDRRIMLISGAAAGMAAVFRAPLTGLVFALEMPYKDDLAHEALLPSLISSVVSYITLAFFLGAAPVFDFETTQSFTGRDLIWCALLGAVIGLIAMTFAITFRRAREFVVGWGVPHWIKLALGGLLTGLCGLGFVLVFHESLIPIGPNYEAVGAILAGHRTAWELIVFGIVKLGATLFSLASGGVSAMFVPLFLSGGASGAPSHNWSYPARRWNSMQRSAWLRLLPLAIRRRWPRSPSWRKPPADMPSSSRRCWARRWPMPFPGMLPFPATSACMRAPECRNCEASGLGKSCKRALSPFKEPRVCTNSPTASHRIPVTAPFPCWTTSGLSGPFLLRR